MTLKLILDALTAIPSIVSTLKGIAASIDKMRDALTEKNIEQYKSEVSDALEKIGKTNNNQDRRDLIADLNRKLSN